MVEGGADGEWEVVWMIVVEDRRGGGPLGQEVPAGLRVGVSAAGAR